ncbi:hypothetical protein [Tabrizicola aquatica]|uniref:hypothetical protein n=1 Tax=Tabrizicola aquatica TaxID=909926 RepID=UPI000CD2B437|nr:hypothetical protein [Tabrizicola aquatica]
MKHLFSAAALVMAAGPALAETLEDRMTTYVTGDVKAWFDDPVILSAVQAANLAHEALTQADIDAMDARWRAEVTSTSGLVASIVDNPASAKLRQRIMEAGGTVTEVIVMDAKGLNVAVSEPSSDYWQGDEEKHQLTYAVGPGALHVSEVELDESTQSYQAQVSFALTDPATGLPIGAVTVGLNAESF